MFLFIENGHVFIPGPWLLLRVPGYHKNPLGSYATYHDDNENNSSTLAWRLLVYFFDASNVRIRRETRSSATFYLNNFMKNPVLTGLILILAPWDSNSFSVSLMINNIGM